ncbi:hypothetical protein [Paraburkholderia ribeironis]|uniref:hypothetical protein n=1 Tax=Paraburkholderia ribeironis TaxID=1247936 RepID=UPI00117792A7|nr:hypothetical protein [Paraburkholderia ribeironis]
MTRSLPDPFEVSNQSNTILPQVGSVMAGMPDVNYRVWDDGSVDALQKKLYGYDPLTQPKQVQAVNDYHYGPVNVATQIEEDRKQGSGANFNSEREAAYSPPPH